MSNFNYKSLVAICVILFVNCGEKRNESQAASIMSEPDFEETQESRVKEERLGYSGVTILTVDAHEYIHYRDGNNAAAVGGIIHKFDCKFCLGKPD